MYLDHIVHFIEMEPEEAVTEWKTQGFHAAKGGRHMNWGTHNALLYLKDQYIEWLAIEKIAIAEEADHPLTQLLLHDKKGFGTVCLRTEEIEQLDERLKAEGIETTGVLDAERKTESGDLIKWKMLFIKEPVSDSLPFPFFIEWGESDDARYEGLRKRGAIRPENEKLSIERCVFGVRDPEASAEKWRTVLGALRLSNCQFEFQKTDKGKERLECVFFADGTRELSFEEGVYYVPNEGNGNKQGKV